MTLDQSHIAGLELAKRAMEQQRERYGGVHKASLACLDGLIEMAKAASAALVVCACGDQYPATSYGAGFIHGSGMCENCDAALPARDILTAPEPVQGEAVAWTWQGTIDRLKNSAVYMPDGVVVWKHKAPGATIPLYTALPSPSHDADLVALMAEMRRGIECDSIHHYPADYHDHDEPCKVLDRIDAKLAELQKVKP